MADMMEFPNTVEEFMEQYKITDTEQIYTNGADLVPIFRMKQWFMHKSDCKDDLISRRQAISSICQSGCGTSYCGISCGDISVLEQLPSAQPEWKKGDNKSKRG